MTQQTVFYTGKGDRGDTGRLGSTERVLKSDPLLETIGTFDEATGAIGMARALAQTPRIQAMLLAAQRALYRLMSHLSATPEARERYPGLHEDDVRQLEAFIAELEAELPPLRDFVVPGDSPAGAACHLARTVVRRAERRLVAFAELEAGIGAPNLAFVNRLSSLLFVAALIEDRCAASAPTLAKEG